MGGDAGELNRLLLDGKWLGKAGLDHLLGDAQLGGLLLNNVGHTDWPVEVVAPQLLKSRAVGLCGDMNGERSADLKTPGMCVLRPRLAALSFMLNKSGAEPGFVRCSGLPAALKEEFQTESAQCPREVIIPTPVSKLYERISLLTRPIGIN